MSDELSIEVPADIDIKILAPEGTGLGEGSISRKKRLQSGEISLLDIQKVEQIIIDPTYYVPVEFGDDGCVDGRGTERSYQVINEKTMPHMSGQPEVIHFKRSGHRSKIAGGSMNIGWVMNRVINGPPQDGETLVDDWRKTAQTLDANGIEYGGHTDSHTEAPNCGCGALDKSVAIIGLAVSYRSEINELVKNLKGQNFNQVAFDDAMDTLTAISQNDQYTQGASGQVAIRILEENGAVIKELGGQHNEVAIVRNHVPGTTFDQARLNAETDDKTQVFVDDVWRREVLAASLGGGHDDLIARADHAGEIITIATTIALTDGSQAIYQRQAA